ncbi:Ceramide synthase 4 [Galemys pyrenaicus]|uniref:sphingosine N-acyltransferase n=1 Tax=Galemys pyrenaicus TaxID=202257 RepID=A0A8J6B304_GALPY|nr:Ceramide synthase 4 [Galemys pyrenaicus]
MRVGEPTPPAGLWPAEAKSSLGIRQVQSREVTRLRDSAHLWGVRNDGVRLAAAWGRRQGSGAAGARPALRRVPAGSSWGGIKAVDHSPLTPAACRLPRRMWSRLTQWLWQDQLWLPLNSSWADLEDRDGRVYAHPRDLLAALPLALAMVVLRFAFERFLALPLSRWMGVRNQTRRPAKPCAVLERHFLQQSQRPEEPQMALLAAQCGLTLQQTRRWFRRRRNQDRPSLTKKFCEASWRFVFYLCSFTGGLSVLYHESWLWTPVMCWDNYPNQPLKPALYWWYLLELSFYISLLLTLPFDIKRKDFKEQVVHHFATVTLVAFSYSANLLRIGSLVLLLHDCADYLLEACKMFNYTESRKVCDVLFLVFAAVFIYTRLVLFPTRILYTTLFESISIIDAKPFFGYYFFNALLLLLQLLHVFWSYLILRMIYSFTGKGQMEKDVRSDVEETDSSDGETAKESPRLKNGAAHGPRAAPEDGPRSRTAWRLANGHAPAL